MATVLISNLPQIQAENIDQFDNLIINDGADTTFSTSRVTIGALKQALFTNDSSATGANQFTGSVSVVGTGASVTAPKFIGALEGDVTGNVAGNVTGNLTGDVTGNVTGTLTGNVIGNVTGNVTGEVSDLSNHSIKALADVSDTMVPNQDDVLAWSGSEWTSVPNEHLELTALSVVTAAASNQGSLSYDDGTGAFTFAPADAYTKSEVDVSLSAKAPSTVGADLPESGSTANTLISDALVALDSAVSGKCPITPAITATNYVSQGNTVAQCIDAFDTAIATKATTATLGTAATTDASDYATAAQGTAADTALQPAAIGVTVQEYHANTVVDADYLTVKSDAAATATTAGQNDNAIDNLIAALVAIGDAGGDANAINTALSALTRDNS